MKGKFMFGTIGKRQFFKKPQYRSQWHHREGSTGMPPTAVASPSRSRTACLCGASMCMCLCGDHDGKRA